MARALVVVVIAALAGRAAANPDGARGAAQADRRGGARGLEGARAAAQAADPNEVVDRDQLRARLLAMAAEDKTAAESAAEGFALERWGMIPPGLDYQAMLVDLLTEQIAGYYDAETKKLTLSQSAGDDPAWAERWCSPRARPRPAGPGVRSAPLRGPARHRGRRPGGAARAGRGDGVALMIEVMVGRAHAKIDWANPRSRA